jgi:hypothetical protein
MVLSAFYDTAQIQVDNCKAKYFICKSVKMTFVLRKDTQIF